MKHLYWQGVFLMLMFAVNTIYAQGISNDARRYFKRGMAAVQVASSSSDYEDALNEFNKAKQLAPNWPDVYYNLGLIYDKLNRYQKAIDSLKGYLKLSPQAQDKNAVEDKIYELEYKLEKASKQKNFLNSLQGLWWGGGHYAIREIRFYVEGDRIEAGVYTIVQAINPHFGPGGMRNYASGYKRIPVERNADTVSFKYNLTFDYSSDANLRGMGNKVIPMFFRLKMASPGKLSGPMVWGDNPSHIVTYKKKVSE